ncbi:MAG: hypothetical protein WCC74_02275 [Minisyncoccia bacterium]
MRFESNVIEIDQEKENAEMAIMSMRDEVAVMGFNDYEMSAFDKILSDLDISLISPQEAVEKAYAIKANKQDYH